MWMPSRVSKLHAQPMDILHEASGILKAWKYVVFCWVSGHAGLSSRRDCQHSCYGGGLALKPDMRMRSKTLMLEPSFVMLFPLPGKMDGSIHRKRNCKWWNHWFRYGNPSVLSGRWHHPDWLHSPNRDIHCTVTSTYLHTMWSTLHHPTHFGEIPTLWQRTSYITSSWHAVQHSWRWSP